LRRIARFDEFLALGKKLTGSRGRQRKHQAPLA
jgi:hypothetical protein